VWKYHCSTDKRYARDNRADFSLELLSTEKFGTLDVGLSHPGTEGGSKRFGCSPMKVVHGAGFRTSCRQFGSLSTIILMKIARALLLSTRGSE
jgi:hypothetical protein